MTHLPVSRRLLPSTSPLERYRQKVALETYKRVLDIRAGEVVAATVTRETANLAHETIDEIDFLTHRGRRIVTHNSDAEPGVAILVTEAEMALARVLRHFAARQLDGLG